MLLLSAMGNKESWGQEVLTWLAPGKTGAWVGVQIHGIRMIIYDGGG